MAQQIGEAHARCALLGVELDRSAQALLRLFAAALPEQRFAEEKMTGGDARRELERGSRERFGTLEVALREVQLGERGQRLSRARLQAHALFELGDGARLVASGGEQPSKLRAQSGIAGV